MARSLLREVTEPAVFIPEVAKRHDVFVRATANWVLVSTRASFSLDEIIRKLALVPSTEQTIPGFCLRQVQNSDRINSDRIGPDQLGPVRVGTGRIDSDRQKINKLRNILNFYIIVGLIPLRNGPFTRHFDFWSFTVFTCHFVLLVPGQANV